MNAHVKTNDLVAAPSFPAFDMADCITSGLIGRDLKLALYTHFPTTPRAAVYEAIAIAWSMAEADLLLAEAERDEALRRLAEMEGSV